MESRDKTDGRVGRSKLGPLTANKEMRARWDDRIAFVLKNGTGHLDPWESEFISSIHFQRKADRDLSSHQSMKLNEIFADLTRRLG